MIRAEFVDPFICYIDPVTATTLAIGSLIGGGAATLAGGIGGSSGASSTATPTIPQQAPPQQAAPQKQSSATNQPSFIGASSVPAAAGSNQKTLLGQ